MNKPIYSPVTELRRYTLHAGRRDELIELFEREFVETQETVGIQVIGQFYDLDDPNQFVWLRGFNDMSAREQSLHAFYSGPIWKAYRDAANATMIDSDNVLLLRLVHPTSGFSLKNGSRPPQSSHTVQDAVRIGIDTFVNDHFGKSGRHGDCHLNVTSHLSIIARVAGDPGGTVEQHIL